MAANAQKPIPGDESKLTAFISGEAQTDNARAAFFETLFSRRSVAPKRLDAPGPTEEELGLIISAGLTAPDHGPLHPWRFLRIPDERRADLANLFAEEKRLYQPEATEAEVEAERARAFNAPTLIALLVNITENHPKVPVHEQYISLGAAASNMLLACHALGYGAMMTSGRKIDTPTLQRAFCKKPSERLIGFLSIGTATRQPRPRMTVERDDHFDDWIG